MVVKTIVHFEIPAQDVEKMSRFYSDVFGWKFTKAQMPEGEYWMISTGPRAKSVGGGMYRKTMEKETPRNYVAVDKMDKAIETFKSAGGTEVVGKQQVPDMGWSFIGMDPEGNLVGLYEAARARPARPRRASGRS